MTPCDCHSNRSLPRTRNCHSTACHCTRTSFISQLCILHTSLHSSILCWSRVPHLVAPTAPLAMLLRLRLQLLLLVSVCVSLAYSSTCGVSSVPSSASSPSPANCGWAGYDFSALADVDVYSTDNDGHMNVFRLCSAVAEPACPALSQLCVWPSPTTLQSTSAVCPAVFAPLSSNASYLWSSTPNAVHVTAYAAQPLYCAAGLPMVTYITLQCNSQAGTVAAENVTIVATNSSADCACQVNVTIQTSLACGTPYFASSSSSGVSSLSATSSLGSSGGSPGSGSSSSNPNPASEMTAVLTTLNAPWGSRQQGGMYVVPSSRPATTVQLSNLTRAVSASHSVTSAVMVYGGFNPTTSQPCNDVWYSADAGVTFSDVVQQNGGYNSQAYGPATCQDIVQQILYSITGDTGAQAGSGQREGTNTVWSSTDLGQSWNAVDATFPGRTNTVCVVDSQSRIFVMAGKQPSNNGDAVSNGRSPTSYNRTLHSPSPLTNSCPTACLFRCVDGHSQSRLAHSGADLDTADRVSSLRCLRRSHSRHVLFPTAADGRAVHVGRLRLQLVLCSDTG